ncbi:sugar phosphate nucleotidyltransferase [Candidatus Midichloria mitochondrii]
MLKNFSITPIILCGGEGSRLWPLSNPIETKTIHLYLG